MEENKNEELLLLLNRINNKSKEISQVIDSIKNRSIYLTSKIVYQRLNIELAFILKEDKSGRKIRDIPEAQDVITALKVFEKIYPDCKD